MRTRTCFSGQYKRTRSYFQNTDYEAKGLPSSAEVELLSQYKDRNSTERVFTEEFQPSVTDAAAVGLSQMRTAFKLLERSGLGIERQSNDQRKDWQAGCHLSCWFTAQLTRSVLQRRFRKTSSVWGIEMKIRTIDTTQYIKRLRDRDFDMVSSSFSQTPYPSFSELTDCLNSNYIDSTLQYCRCDGSSIDALTATARNQQHPGKASTLGRSLWIVYCSGISTTSPQWHVGEYRAVNVGQVWASRCIALNTI